MRIIDSQVHIWDKDRPDRPWPPGQAGREHWPEPLTAEGLLTRMRDAGVQRAVLVPPSWEGDRNDLVLAAAQEHPDTFAAMGRLPLVGKEAPQLFDDLARQRGLLGFRFTFHLDLTRHLIRDGSANWLWQAAETAGLPLMINVPGLLKEVDAIAARHPGLKLILDHMAVATTAKDEEAFVHLPDLLHLARHPNIGVKASCVPRYSSAPYPYKNIHAYLRQVFDAFGPERMFWGSDLTHLHCTYRQSVTLFTEELPWLSSDDMEWIMGKSLSTWLNWP